MQRAQRLSSIPPDFTRQIAGVKAQALSAGRDVIDLASDDLDLPLPLAVREELGTIVSEASVSGGDNSAQAEFHQAAAHWYEGRLGVSLDADGAISQIAGNKAALASTLWAAVNPGDVVLVPALAEPWVKANVLLAGGVPHDVPLRADDGWLPDLTAVPGDVVRLAKLLYLSYPHNPTGAVATLPFFQATVNFAQETGVTILHDATYASWDHDGYQAPSILTCAGAQDVALEIHALPFLDVPGFMVGSPDAVRAINTVKANVSSEAPVAVTRAAIWALNNAHLDETPAALTRRRAILSGGLNSLGWHVSPPEAGPFVWLPVPTGHTSASFAQALFNQADVLTLPGLAFGPSGDGHVRLSLAASEERLGEAVRRMSLIT